MRIALFADRPEATFARIARAANCDLLLFGHTYLPYKKQVGDTLFVNTGSVGKPKDGDPRTICYADTGNRHNGRGV